MNNRSRGQAAPAQPPAPAALLALHRAGLTRVFLVALVVTLVALLLPGLVGGILLLVVVAAMATVLTLTWPLTATNTRILRVLVLAGLTTIAFFKVF